MPLKKILEILLQVVELGWVPRITPRGAREPPLCAGKKEGVSRRGIDTAGLSLCKSWARAKFQSRSSRI